MEPRTQSRQIAVANGIGGIATVIPRKNHAADLVRHVIGGDLVQMHSAPREPRPIAVRSTLRMLYATRPIPKANKAAGG